METCGVGRPHGQGDRQAHGLDPPTRRRTPTARVYALVAGLPEHKIQIISPDIGGGFGNKVGIYPGYVLAVVGSIVTGKPVKWMEDRSENLMSTAFARDYHMHGEIAATSDGKILGLRVDVLADHGAFNGTAPADQVPGRLLPHLHRQLRPRRPRTARSPASTPTRRRAASRTPARSASPRPCTWSSGWSTASPTSWSMDPAELRMKNLLRPEQFPYTTQDRLGVRLRRLPAGAAAWRCDMAGYDELRARAGREARAGRADGHRLSFFTEGVGAGPRKHMDILGLGMADGCELRVHPTGKA